MSWAMSWAKGGMQDSSMFYYVEGSKRFEAAIRICDKSPTEIIPGFFFIIFSLHEHAIERGPKVLLLRLANHGARYRRFARLYGDA